MGGLEQILKEHPFFRELSGDDIHTLAGCAKNVRFAPGEEIFHEGDPADWFYLIREGVVDLEVAPGGHAPRVLLRLHAGEVLGVSWLFPPYRWLFTARAKEPVRALALNGACLREKCERDHDLGYALMRLFSQELVHRLQAARLQLLDIYGGGGG